MEIVSTAFVYNYTTDEIIPYAYIDTAGVPHVATEYLNYTYDKLAGSNYCIRYVQYSCTTLPVLCVFDQATNQVNPIFAYTPQANSIMPLTQEVKQSIFECSVYSGLATQSDIIPNTVLLQAYATIYQSLLVSLQQLLAGQSSSTGYTVEQLLASSYTAITPEETSAINSSITAYYNQVQQSQQSQPVAEELTTVVTTSQQPDTSTVTEQSVSESTTTAQDSEEQDTQRLEEQPEKVEGTINPVQENDKEHKESITDDTQDTQSTDNYNNELSENTSVDTEDIQSQNNTEDNTSADTEDNTDNDNYKLDSQPDDDSRQTDNPKPNTEPQVEVQAQSEEDVSTSTEPSVAVDKFKELKEVLELENDFSVLQNSIKDIFGEELSEKLVGAISSSKLEDIKFEIQSNLQAEYERKAAEFEDKYSEMSNVQAELEKQIQGHKESEIQLMEKVDELQKEKERVLEEKENDIKDNERLIQKLQEKIDNTIKDTDESRELVNTYKEEIDKLQQDNKSLTEAMKEIESESSQSVSELQNKLNELMKEKSDVIEENRKNHIKLQELIVDRDTQISEITSKYEKMVVALEDTNKSLKSDYEKTVSSLEDKLSSLEKQLEEVSEEKNLTQEQLDEIQKEKETYQLDLGRYKLEYEESIKVLERTEELAQEQLNTIANQKKELTDRVQVLEEQLKHVSEENKRLQERASGLQEQLTASVEGELKHLLNDSIRTINNTSEVGGILSGKDTGNLQTEPESGKIGEIFSGIKASMGMPQAEISSGHNVYIIDKDNQYKPDTHQTRVPYTQMYNVSTAEQLDVDTSEVADGDAVEDEVLELYNYLFDVNNPKVTQEETNIFDVDESELIALYESIKAKSSYEDKSSTLYEDVEKHLTNGKCGLSVVVNYLSIGEFLYLCSIRIPDIEEVLQHTSLTYSALLMFITLCNSLTNRNTGHTRLFSPEFADLLPSIISSMLMSVIRTSLELSSFADLVEKEGQDDDDTDDVSDTGEMNIDVDLTENLVQLYNLRISVRIIDIINDRLFSNKEPNTMVRNFKEFCNKLKNSSYTIDVSEPSRVTGVVDVFFKTLGLENTQISITETSVDITTVGNDAQSKVKLSPIVLGKLLVQAQVHVKDLCENLKYDAEELVPDVERYAYINYSDELANMKLKSEFAELLIGYEPAGKEKVYELEPVAILHPCTPNGQGIKSPVGVMFINYSASSDMEKYVLLPVAGTYLTKLAEHKIILEDGEQIQYKTVPGKPNNIYLIDIKFLQDYTTKHMTVRGVVIEDAKSIYIENILKGVRNSSVDYKTCYVPEWVLETKADLFESYMKVGFATIVKDPKKSR